MRTAPFRHATAPLDLRDRTSRHCLSRQAKDYTLKSGMVPSVGRVEIAGNAAETQNHASTQSCINAILYRKGMYNLHRFVKVFCRREDISKPPSGISRMRPFFSVSFLSQNGAGYTFRNRRKLTSWPTCQKRGSHENIRTIAIQREVLSDNAHAADHPIARVTHARTVSEKTSGSPWVGEPLA